MKMKVFCLFLLLASMSGFSQTGGLGKLNRIERKALKEERRMALETAVVQMIKDTTFVLEATRIEQNYGSDYLTVNPNLFFVVLEKDKVLFQMGLTDALNLAQFSGRTVEGRITRMKISESKRGQTTKISATMVSDIGRFVVDFIISPYGQASATIESIDRGKVTFRGTLVSPENSSIYVGGPIF